MKCPICNIEMELLVSNIYQCPKCKKIRKDETVEVEKESKKEEASTGTLIDGEWFHKHASLNKKYEIAESGVIVNKTENRMLGVLACRNPLLKEERYVRLSWWKQPLFRHAGMIKIYEDYVLKNLIKALKKIDQNYDPNWKFIGKYDSRRKKTKEQLEKEKKLEILKWRILENSTCPKCNKKMEKMKGHYECPHCGEIVILEEYNQPIFNIDPADLDMRFHSNFPINYYMPVNGITIKWLMGEWKAIVVIYSVDNPNKKWLRFYWWTRNLGEILKKGRREIGEGVKMGWQVKKGTGSPNIYNKELFPPLIDALKIIAKEMDWKI
ncbi:MAG: hypothetical protein ACTSXH_11735 [Promethearchaeota archaeon]